MKTTNMITMKTIYFLTAFLGLQFNTIFAAVNFSESPVLSNEVMLSVATAVLMPATPVEATFEDVADIKPTTLNLSALMPVIPMIADFSDEAPVPEISLIDLAPVTPEEADFEDVTGTNKISSIMDLAPVTPAEADFEDHA